MHTFVLLGYLSTDKISRSGLMKKEQRVRNQRVFHESMRLILEPLEEEGRTGVEMTGGDGSVRRVYPILAAYVADYPEQCLVTCTKYGTCPKCQCPANELGDPTASPERTPQWTTNVMSSAKAHSVTSAQFYEACMIQEVSGTPTDPFWKKLPLANIHDTITPDVLHQLYQGVFKHLVNWCTRIVGAEELDRRIRTLPPMHGVCHFKNSFSALSQISGSERKHMVHILLGCLVSVLPQQGILACCALLEPHATHRSLPKYPSQPRKPITTIERQHNAPSFSQALKLLLNQTLPQPTSVRVALGHPLPFEKVDVFHIFKFHPTRIDDEAVVELERDVIKASPGRNGKPGTFDTVVVLQRDDAESTGLRGEQDGDQYHYIISSSHHYRYNGRTSQSHFQATREALCAGTNNQPPLYLAQ